MAPSAAQFDFRRLQYCLELHQFSTVRHDFVFRHTEPLLRDLDDVVYDRDTGFRDVPASGVDEEYWKIGKAPLDNFDGLADAFYLSLQRLRIHSRAADGIFHVAILSFQGFLSSF